MKPLLRYFSCVLRVIVLLEGKPSAQSEVLSTLEKVFVQDIPVLGRIHLSLDCNQSSCPCSWKTPPQHDAATTMLHCWDCIGQVMSSAWFSPHIPLRIKAKKLLDYGGHCALRNLKCSRIFFVTLARSVPCHNSVSELFRQFLWPHDSHLVWHALWAVRSYIDRCVAFLIKSNQYNQTQLDSNEGVEPSQGWSEEMDSTWVKYECHRKGSEYLGPCDISVFLF